MIKRLFLFSFIISNVAVKAQINLVLSEKMDIEIYNLLVERLYVAQNVLEQTNKS